jgi:hypothetical protein
VAPYSTSTVLQPCLLGVFYALLLTSLSTVTPYNVTDDDELSHHSASSAYNDGPSTYSPTASSPASPQQRGEVSFAATEQGGVPSVMLFTGCVLLL